MGLPATVSPADSLRAFVVGPETLTSGTGVSAGLATYQEMIPVKSFKNELVDARLVTNELIGTLIRDTSTVRLYKHNEPTFSAYQRFDKVGWLLRNMIGTPTTTRVGTGSTNNVQIITLASTAAASSGWLSTETFQIGIGGYLSSPIAFGSTGAILYANLTPALNAMPSVVSAASTGTRNISISPGTFTASTATFALSCSNNLLGVNMPTYLVSGTTATGAISVANSTPGVGSFQHVFTVGNAGKLPLTMGEYDGVSYKLCQSGAIDTADLTLAMNDAPLWAIKSISQAEVDYASILATSTSTYIAGTFPNYFFSQYLGATDPSMMALTVNGSSFATMIAGKLSGKNNRDPLNVMGGSSTDMIRALEGPVNWTGSMTLRYTAFTNSEYSKFISNFTPAGAINTPGAINFSWQDTNTTIGGNQKPTATYAIPNPKYVKGSRNPEPSEPQQGLDFICLMDQVTQTSMTVTLTNETPRYTALT